MHNILVSIMTAFCCAATAQAADPLRRGREQTIFSFRLKHSDKHVSILESTDKQKPYLVYRFGTADAVELEFPAKKDDAWSQFTYWYYLRPGGPQNEGLDLNYLSFVNKGWEYVVYDEYAAVDNSSEAGVLVVRLKDCKVTDLIGRHDSITGSLVGLRWNEALVRKDETADPRCRGKIAR